MRVVWAARLDIIFSLLLFHHGRKRGRFPFKNHFFGNREAQPVLQDELLLYRSLVKHVLCSSCQDDGRLRWSPFQYVSNPPPVQLVPVLLNVDPSRHLTPLSLSGSSCRIKSYIMSSARLRRVLRSLILSANRSFGWPLPNLDGNSSLTTGLTSREAPRIEKPGTSAWALPLMLKPPTSGPPVMRSARLPARSSAIVLCC